ncbi:ATP-dependent DNA ligase [Leifsonia sp. F6_8S_P_1B]|uniref:ATP-dependent DNA ligase n=1 Tax=Leifsonia williamsii TaxID=3035919 RepID=A0ABT8KBN6_9MICO|nr:ATP-dependent DNA ligase [Leifsonia williamsii]MDN4613754.1 ATP-dependent DNA ligase [Leifsonia williamsii]
MGYFAYDGREVEFDDRTLAHLHVVIINKLRSGQSFAFSWKDPADSGGGRTSVWLHPTSNVMFHFSGSRAPVLNRGWLARLAETADGPRGLIVEPEEQPVREEAKPTLVVA